MSIACADWPLCDVPVGIFSRLWANILANSVVDAQPDLTDAAALERWLGKCRERWEAGIDVSALRYTQQLLRNVGAGATLLVLQLAPQSPVSDYPEGSLAWKLGRSATAASSGFAIIACWRLSPHSAPMSSP